MTTLRPRQRSLGKSRRRHTAAALERFRSSGAEVYFEILILRAD